jgi:hypothetical protein
VGEKQLEALGGFQGGGMVGSQDDVTVKLNEIFGQLIQLTSEFAEQADNELPAVEEIAAFEEARGNYYQRLQPLLDQQNSWLAEQGRGRLSSEAGRQVEEQLAAMRRLKELDAGLVRQLGKQREVLGEEMGLLRNRKRGLAGYQSSKSGKAARLFRGSA